MSSVVVVWRTSCCSPGALAGAPVAPMLVEAILDGSGAAALLWMCSVREVVGNRKERWNVLLL